MTEKKIWKLFVQSFNCKNFFVSINKLKKNLRINFIEDVMKIWNICKKDEKQFDNKLNYIENSIFISF